MQCVQLPQLQLRLQLQLPTLSVARTRFCFCVGCSSVRFPLYGAEVEVDAVSLMAPQSPPMGCLGGGEDY